MRISETGLALVLVGKLREVVDDVHELLLYKLERVAHDDDVGVVANVAGGRTQVDYSRRLGALLSVCVYMGHYVVAYQLLALLSDLIVDVGDVGFQFVYHFLCDLVYAEVHLCPCESDPQTAPCGKLLVCGEDVLHLLACIACAERAFIGGIIS